ncbi:hypothetical protein C7B61_15465 [filamentous cyanobacterium CCP1]|nr:hypothetical protein C7B76_31410 [filamentous cyanobacterium CCP2]PSB61759.1 hypothetical protein C7B61_15465 [filamentous cyanobacterium CCP1]
MLFSLLALAIGVSAIYISRKLMDEITHLLLNLIGLFSLLFSLVYSFWFIKLAIVVIVAMTPTCAQQQYLRQIRCPFFCVARLNCPDFSL